MSFKLSYMELVTLVQSFGYDNDTSNIVADYLDECIDYEFDLSNYLWNTLPYFVQCFDSKKELEEYVNNELHIDINKCIIFKSTNSKGYYLEWR